MSAEQHHEDSDSNKEGQRINERADLMIAGAPRDTVFVLGAGTDSGRAWIEENVSKDGYQPWWPDVLVEHRYLRHLVEAAKAAGLEVDFGWREATTNQHEP